MPSETFSLPQTSIDVLEKVIIGYANAGNEVGREDVAGIIGLHANRVSENNDLPPINRLSLKFRALSE